MGLTLLHKQGSERFFMSQELELVVAIDFSDKIRKWYVIENPCNQNREFKITRHYVLMSHYNTSILDKSLEKIYKLR